MSKPTEISISVKVSDGSFDASLSFPVTASAQQIKDIVATWMQALDNAVKLTQVEREEHMNGN